MTAHQLDPPDRPLRVALLGGFGVGNLGNDASLEALIDVVRRVDSEAQIVCVCPKPDVVMGRYNIDAVAIRARRPTGARFDSRIAPLLKLPYRLGDLTRAASIARSADAVIVPGTGILDDFGGEKFTGWPLTLLTWLGIARLFRTRTALVAIGAGPLVHPASRRIAKYVANIADHRSFRDRGSLEFMRSIGVDVSESELVPDIVFGSRPSHPSRLAHSRPIVAVAVMKYSGWYADKRTDAMLSQHVVGLGEFCSWLLASGYAVRLITADIGDQPATELVEAHAIRARPDLAERWLTSAEAQNLQELQGLLSDASVVVASRYHSVISALLCGKPTLSIGYATKNDDLMEAVGLGQYCQHLESVDQLELRAQFRGLMRDGEWLSRRVIAAVGEFRARLLIEEAALRSRVLARAERPELWGMAAAAQNRDSGTGPSRPRE